jgi:undecaprenyl-diphosphatase
VSLRVRANALDLALYRRVRRVARTPGTVRSYSRLGEHGAVWLATGAAGITFDWGHRRRLLPSPLLYAAAAAMGLSRLSLGVHYPSDVAAGAALGTLMGTLGR